MSPCIHRLEDTVCGLCGPAAVEKLRAKLAAAERERDELREKLAVAHAAVRLCSDEECKRAYERDAARDEAAKQVGYCLRLKSKYDEIVQERDRLAAELADARDNATRSAAELADAIRERDEARTGPTQVALLQLSESNTALAKERDAALKRAKEAEREAGESQAALGRVYSAIEEGRDLARVTLERDRLAGEKKREG